MPLLINSIYSSAAYYVEVNHVKALVVQGNICTTNGYIHKVDRIVGTPDGSIGDYLGRRVGLRWVEMVKLIFVIVQLMAI